MIILLLSISFSVIYICQKESLSRKGKYPKVNCHEVDVEYAGRDSRWENDAVQEFKLNQEYSQSGLETHFGGALQCFCASQKKQGVSKDTMYKLFDGNGEVSFESPVCLHYSNDIFWSQLIGQSIAFIIIAVNLVLKVVIIKLVEWIGEDTQSVTKAMITSGIFYAQFFNTGILILLVNANLSEHT